MSSITAKDSGDNKPVKLRILDSEVQIACKPGQENDLAKAAAYVDKSMRELRVRNASSSIEKIAIVTAINSANLLLQLQSSDRIDSDFTKQLTTINAQLEELLADS